MSKFKSKNFLKKLLHAQAYYLFIALGGSLGAVTRIFVFAFIPNSILATLICNICGTFLLSCVIEMGRHIYPELRNSIVVGFCGGLSIFATFSKDSVVAIKSNDYFLFFPNFFANFALCIASVFLAIWIAKKIRLIKYGSKKSEAKI